MKRGFRRIVATVLSGLMVVGPAFSAPSPVSSFQFSSISPLSHRQAYFNTQTVTEPDAWHFLHGFLGARRFHSISPTISDIRTPAAHHFLFVVNAVIVSVLMMQLVLHRAMDAVGGVSLANMMTVFLPSPPTGDHVPKAFDRLLEGVGESTPDWQRLNLLAALMLDKIEDTSAPIAGWEIENLAPEILARYGLPTDKLHVMRMLGQLVDLGVSGKVHGGYYRLGAAAFRDRHQISMPSPICSVTCARRSTPIARTCPAPRTGHARRI